MRRFSVAGVVLAIGLACVLSGCGDDGADGVSAEQSFANPDYQKMGAGSAGKMDDMPASAKQAMQGSPMGGMMMQGQGQQSKMMDAYRNPAAAGKAGGAPGAPGAPPAGK